MFCPICEGTGTAVDEDGIRSACAECEGTGEVCADCGEPAEYCDCQDDD